MLRLIDKVLRPSNIKRILFFGLADVVLIITSLYFAFQLRFEFEIPEQHYLAMQAAFFLFVVIKIAAFAVFRVYNATWRFFGLRDLWNMLNALLVAEAVLMVLILVPLPESISRILSFHISGFPRLVFVRDTMISFILLSGLRLSKRIYLEVITKKSNGKQGARTIVVGAGSTGEMILRDIIKSGYSSFYPVALLDDDPVNKGNSVHGVKVVGTLDDLKEAVGAYRAAAIIIAIPSLNHKKLKALYSAAKDANVGTVKIVPRIYDMHKPNIRMKSLEDISIEDLIGRPDVKIDFNEVEGFIRDKVVLVTGAGGSIGSELASQICAFHPRQLVLLDADETEIHAMQLKLSRNVPGGCSAATDGRAMGRLFVVGDIRDRELLDNLFASVKPDIVFHAAAYKHVPIMEYNPYEAVKVNIFGTHNLAEASVRHGVAKFIMISTDKAVQPTSIMGATKRIAEYVCRSYNSHKKTDFVSVRFGNVLGSRGSVLPIFLQQLKQGGPITVTHKDMRRYFMTIHEAVLLVLQASVIGEDGQVMVLDMGDPVKIVDMAEELIRMHDLEPYKDIDIEFMGMRPGEKLFEEILTAEEGTLPSRHNKVFVAKDSKHFTPDDMSRILTEFRDTLRNSPYDDEGRAIRTVLRKHVQHYEAGRQADKLGSEQANKPASL